jgi:hypothetical protein
VWASECFDPLDCSAPGLAVGRSSSPCDIFKELSRDCDEEERHSRLVAGYAKRSEGWLQRGWPTTKSISSGTMRYSA